MKRVIDFNADIGEGFPNDAALMKLVTSVNIACGAHAGNSTLMFETVRLAKLHGLRIGAHPGYRDRANFGRVEQHITPAELYPILHLQVLELDVFAHAHEIPLHYVKPHGAMYHQCSRDAGLAKALIRLAKQMQLAIMGQPGTVLEAETHAAGVPYIREGFADRRYQPDGTLTPRSQPDAMLRDPLEAAKQVRWLIDIKEAQSICVHGDEPGAVEFLKQVKAHLAEGRA